MLPLILQLIVAAEPGPDFRTQVLPVLTRAGCNSGSCHGAAIGRGGLRLSLLGQDPAADHESLVFELDSRRVDLVRPERSLMLRKATMQTVHEGGLRLRRTDEGFSIVRDWIRAGAKDSPGAAFVGIDIEPPATKLDRVGATFTIKVTARFADGMRRDVTRWSLITPADGGAVSVSASGEVTVKRRGRHVIQVRFLEAISAATVCVPLTDEPAPARGPAGNFIDEHVNATLDELRLPTAPTVDDAGFVRRLHLDLTGSLPTPEALDAFLADKSPRKRAELIDRLLTGEGYVEHASHLLRTLVGLDAKRLERPAAEALSQWIARQVRDNAPWDRTARELLSARGDSHQVGPAAFARLAGDAGSHAEMVSRVFLGVRLACANCHNHPLDRWTQDDYHGLSAVFARLDRGRVVRDRERGETIHPRTGLPARPRIPGVGPTTGDATAALAAWVTADRQFARAAVNRLWRQMMGRGLVEPADDHRASNPPTHPALLDALADDFARHGFDARRTLRLIANSQAYQRARAIGTDADLPWYGRSGVRPLSAEVMVDAVSDVTGVAERFEGAPAGARAIALLDSGGSRVLELLGRCGPDTGCAARPTESGSPALMLQAINGEWLNAKISDPAGRLHRLIAAGRSDDDILQEMHRRAWGRPMHDDEKIYWRKRLSVAGRDGRAAALEDCVWTLLSGAEFLR